jgi:polyisoprenoid-binding protein YceI
VLRRRRAWHEPAPRGWSRALRGLLVAAVGISVPVVVAVWVTASFAPRPAEPPPPPALGRTGASAGGGDLSGRWTLDAEHSWVGYRIGEYIPRLNDTFEVVGRTDAVSGMLALTDGRIEGAWVEADLRALTSDNERRDRAIQRRFLESAAYPEARFAITEPIALLGTPEPGEPTTVPVTGTLTLREQSAVVRPLLRARWDGGEELRVVGTLPVTLDAHGIRNPVLPGFRTVAEDATIELDLTFTAGD